ncbi:hypothetical protein L195_g033543, partial [Trifolium pratense]
PVTVSVSHQFSPFVFPGKSPRHSTAVFSASSTDDSHIDSQDLAVLLEVDGVLVDAYRVGNRLAFNKAFEKFGLDCASWNEPVYSDLLRFHEFMSINALNFFETLFGKDLDSVILCSHIVADLVCKIKIRQIGWPSSLPTNEKGLFTKSVLQAKVVWLGCVVLFLLTVTELSLLVPRCFWESLPLA